MYWFSAGPVIAPRVRKHKLLTPDSDSCSDSALRCSSESMVALVRIPSEVAQQIAPKASVAELQQAQGQQEHEKLDKDVEEALEEQAPALLSESEATLRERDIEIQEIERIAKDLGCVFENGRIIVQDDYDAKLGEYDSADMVAS